ncbi:MAG: type III secretion system protein [Salinarimonadaceae bacterium]|nr:MAG: type III secretion system protein [Salinarimonadaceae bacterium]
MVALNRFLAECAKRQDLVFAFFFVLIVAMLVLPLPTWLIDALLAINLTLSLVVLISATYLRSPLEMSSFPSIILMTSIMRVALSVATTRLILATGDPGALIVAFGQFVISGNLVVGLVIFLIIAVVQFMVVTKGAERISEVAARFTLDALPGKQMSIDNDVRAGDITAEEARDKRQTLQLEMQFHGAMDGAMRFVKGDAIAGLIIVFINLVGGMTIGMAQRGLSAGEAGQLYVLLSVGDGLIAQIPAMFIALAAGTIVTRVTTDKSSNLGQDITRQIGADPKALGVAGIVAVSMGFIPGFPTAVFLILGSMLCAGAFALTRSAAKRAADDALDGSRAAPAPSPDGDDSEADPSDPMTAGPDEPLPLRPVQPGDIMVVNGEPGTLEKLRPDEVYEHVEYTKALFLRRMGFSAPPVGFREDPNLAPGEFVIEIDDVPMSRFVIAGVDPDQPLNEEQAREYAGRIAAIRFRHAASLFGVPEATQWLEDIKPSCGRLATDIQQLMPFMTLVETLRRLLDDGVGLAPPRLVLEGLVQASQRSQDPDMAAEIVRSLLQRQISHFAAVGSNVINALVLAPDIEGVLRQSSAPDQRGPAIRAADETVQAFIAQARDAVARNEAEYDAVAFLTPSDLRRPLHKLLKQHGVITQVLAFSDVAPGFEVRTVEVVSRAAQAA